MNVEQSDSLSESLKKDCTLEDSSLDDYATNPPHADSQVRTASHGRAVAPLYYMDGVLQLTPEKLKAEECALQIEPYGTNAVPPRALPYKSDAVISALGTYGPLFRTAMIDLERIRMALIYNERTMNGPSNMAALELISNQYPTFMRDVVGSCISSIQSKPVSHATFEDGVLQLAMTIAMVAQAGENGLKAPP